MPEPQTLLRHKHSKARYWYVGDVYARNIAVLVPKDDATKAYTVAHDEIAQYYDVVSEEGFELYKLYKSDITEATFYVDGVYTNPDTQERVAFGWYKRVGANKRQAIVLEERLFDNWRIVK